MKPRLQRKPSQSRARIYRAFPSRENRQSSPDRAITESVDKQFARLRPAVLLVEKPPNVRPGQLKGRTVLEAHIEPKKLAVNG